MVESPLKKILNEMTRVEGVKAVLVVSKEGFTIDFSAVEEVDPESIAAMIVTLYGAATRFGEEFKLGNLEILTSEYENAVVLIAEVGDALVVMLADKSAILGRIRYELKRQKERIRAAL